ncbi:tuberoinfundibular peptide of 39 residues [Engraulis encrasicolus]|uniref:tuberoinfundibular peptide of 39 residues n=1 Tax=Engraulis encrasicolus TaxID=184585 RepID=UPI002FD24173
MAYFNSARLALVLLALMSVTLVTSGFPQHRLGSLRNPSAIGPDDSKTDQWEMHYPSISLRDWNIQMLSAPYFGSANKRKPEILGGDEWDPLSQSQLEEEVAKTWMGDWMAQPVNEEKRNIVVADDAAFREKSKLLTAMERQKWLNSYMQKLLVVNS